MNGADHRAEGEEKEEEEKEGQSVRLQCNVVSCHAAINLLLAVITRTSRHRTPPTEVPPSRAELSVFAPTATGDELCPVEPSPSLFSSSTASAPLAR